MNYFPRCPLLTGLVLSVAVQAAVAQAAAPAQSPQSPQSVPPKESLSLASSQTGVALTIYNENLALVKDARRVPFNVGRNAVAWRGVAAQMRPETALLRDTSDTKNSSGLRLIEQNFDFDLLTPAKLLEKHVGQKVSVIKTNFATGVETREDATVLSINEGTVLKFADRVESNPSGRIIFNSVPETLRDQPTLVISAHSDKGGERAVELSYLTRGLAWKADYVAELAPDEKSFALNGWVTLTNRSGAAYQNAKLQLVAGDVNQVRDEMQYLQASRRAQTMDAPAPPVAMQEESLLDFHLYSLAHTTTLKENQTKQVALLSAQQVNASKTYRLDGHANYYQSAYGDLAQKLKVAVVLSFENKKPALGLPLPRGVVRVYKRDLANNAQFVGEDRIDHTPENESARLKLGDAFDVTASRRQTDFKRVDAGANRSAQFESAYEFVLKNAKKEAVSVQVVEPIPGTWEVLQESHPHKKAAAHAASWSIKVPAGGEARLTYRVRVRF